MVDALGLSLTRDLVQPTDVRAAASIRLSTSRRAQLDEAEQKLAQNSTYLRSY
jgi:hypothetical protein